MSMKAHRIAYLLICFQMLVACGPSENSDPVNNCQSDCTEESDEMRGLKEENNEKLIRDAFKKKYPEPENLKKIKALWMSADSAFRESMSKGFAADVYVNDYQNNVSNGNDVYIRSNKVNQLREYRGKSHSFTFDGMVCVNHITYAESIDDLENVTVEYLPSAENKFDWTCEKHEEGSLFYGIFEFDFDKVISSSIADITFNGEELREINLVVADDFDFIPYEYNREVTLIIGRNDVKPRVLKTRYTYGRNVVEYAQWDYNYDKPVEFIELPKDRMKME